MAKDKTQSKLSEQQIAFACALSVEPKTFSELIAQTKLDGFLGTIENPHWKKLVDLEIAQRFEDGIAHVVGLIQGPRWREFYDRHGHEHARKRLEDSDAHTETEYVFDGLI